MAETRTSIPHTNTELPPSADPLADPLRLMKLTGVLHCQAEFTAPWGLKIPRIPGCMAVHIVNSGSFYLDIAGQQTIEVSAGSVVMIPHGTEHQLRSSPGVETTPLTEVPVELITERYERMRMGGGGESTSVSYCGVRYDPVAAARLIQALPLTIHVDTLTLANEWLQQTSRFISEEAQATRPGSEAIVTRLADIVVVQTIRSWFETSEGEHSWLAALRDQQIGKALAVMHREPLRDWSVAALASDIGMSRSALSARFSKLVGQSVIQYLTEWRMQLAREELLGTGKTIAALVDKYGYHSEAAFSRAFKRTFGVTPGHVRKSASLEE